MSLTGFKVKLEDPDAYEKEWKRKIRWYIIKFENRMQ